MKMRARDLLDKLRVLHAEKKRCTLYLDKKYFEELVTIAKKENQPISQIVDVLIKFFVSSYKENGKHKAPKQ